MIEEHCGRLRLLGANPAIAVDKLRPYTQRIWQHLSLEEKHEFIRRYAARWNVTRHRIAAEIFQKVSNAQAEGRLRIVTGCIRDLRPLGSKIGVTVEGAGSTRVVLEASLVINGTGPNTAFSSLRIPLYQNLLGAGRIAVDDLDMGVRVDDNFAVIDGDGQPSTWMFALGPLLRGPFGKRSRSRNSATRRCVSRNICFHCWEPTNSFATVGRGKRDRFARILYLVLWRINP